jgi:hypothetical protein
MSRRARPRCTAVSMSWRHPRPEPATSAVRSAPGDSYIGCEEPMAIQCPIGSKHPSRETDSLDTIRAIDPETNGWHLLKSVGQWANDDGSSPRCCGYILQIFLKENNSINPENHWNLRILQKNTPKLFHNYILVPLILHLGPCLTFYNYNQVIFLINLLILITYLIY